MATTFSSSLMDALLPLLHSPNYSHNSQGVACHDTQNKSYSHEYHALKHLTGSCPAPFSYPIRHHSPLIFLYFTNQCWFLSVPSTHQVLPPSGTSFTHTLLCLISIRAQDPSGKRTVFVRQYITNTWQSLAHSSCSKSTLEKNEWMRTENKF